VDLLASVSVSVSFSLDTTTSREEEEKLQTCTKAQAAHLIVSRLYSLWQVQTNNSYKCLCSIKFPKAYGSILLTSSFFLVCSGLQGSRAPFIHLVRSGEKKMNDAQTQILGPVILMDTTRRRIFCVLLHF
jgi:hypothetical protein